MSFKVGDKVRIVKFPDTDVVGREAIITNVYCNSGLYPYRVKDLLDNSWDCLMQTNEIEKIIVKNQQLLFDFMQQS